MYVINCDEMSSNVKVCQQKFAKRIFKFKYIYIGGHTYILRYDMHHSSMCGTVLNNAVYVFGVTEDI